MIQKTASNNNHDESVKKIIQADSTPGPKSALLRSHQPVWRRINRKTKGSVTPKAKSGKRTTTARLRAAAPKVPRFSSPSPAARSTKTSHEKEAIESINSKLKTPTDVNEVEIISAIIRNKPTGVVEPAKEENSFSEKKESKQKSISDRHPGTEAAIGIVQPGEFTMDLVQNFDRIPRPDTDSPGFAYKPEKPIRTKSERAKLEGWDCSKCRQYYEAIASQLTDEELKKIKNKCSRHRSKYPVNISETPPNYWDPDFPTTEECIEQGYMGIGVRTPLKKSPQKGK